MIFRQSKNQPRTIGTIHRAATWWLNLDPPSSYRNNRCYSAEKRVRGRRDALRHDISLVTSLLSRRIRITVADSRGLRGECAHVSKHLITLNARHVICRDTKERARTHAHNAHTHLLPDPSSLLDTADGHITRSTVRHEHATENSHFADY